MNRTALRLALSTVLLIAGSCTKKTDAAATPVEAAPAAAPAPEESPPLPEVRGEPDPQPEIRKICMKIAEVFIADPDAPEDMKSDSADIEACIADAVEERERDPEHFDRQGECILGASSPEGIFKCVLQNAHAGDNTE